ncbi:MAG: RNA ligase RtcB family protein [Polyangiales bacterium]
MTTQTTNLNAQCPAHANIITSEGVWMEGEAILQFARVAQLEGCVRAAGMPDLHPGAEFPIGAVIATRGVVYPQLIGGDAGCGARLVVTEIDRVSQDRLERRARDAFEEPLFDGVAKASLFETVWYSGARGLAELEGLPDALRELAMSEPAHDGYPASGSPNRFPGGFEQALGTIGGGNHFAEISRIDKVCDRAQAAVLGIEKGALVTLVHSGSRGLGAALGALFGVEPIRGETIETYRGELSGACRFARANRLVLTYRLLRALGATRSSVLRGTFDVTHNDVRPEPVSGTDAWVHRKGAAPAYEGQPTVVLGSRGAPSWIMVGCGHQAGLRSIAHGAGRRMSRSEARDKLRARYRRTEIERSPLGGRILCDDRNLLFEEHPDAYKSIEPIMVALETHALASRVASVVPILTVKL